MLTLIISLIVATLAGMFFAQDLNSPGWGIFCGVIIFMLSQLTIGLILRRKINAQQQKLQMLMEGANTKMNRQLNLFQQRQPGNMSGAKQLADRLQHESAKQMLDELNGFKKYYKWSMMLYRQIDAMKAQLYFQLRDYATVDKLLEKALLADPQTIAIKMVRLYKHDDEKGLDNFFRKKCAKLKGEAGAFTTSVYAWIKIKVQQPEKAMAALNAVKKRSDNPIVLENLEKLANGKTKQFSNAGFGTNWYALGLEEYKVKQQRMKHPRPF